MSKSGVARNSLGAAYVAAEALYDNAVAMSLFLDAWSRRFVTPDLNPSAANHLRQNLMNAQSNLNALRQALAEALDAVATETGDKPCPVSDGCGGGRVRGRSATPAGSAPGAPFGVSGPDGSSI